MVESSSNVGIVRGKAIRGPQGLSGKEATDKATELWREWLKEGDTRAIETFYWVNRRGEVRAEPGGCAWVRRHTDLGRIVHEEWEGLANLGLKNDGGEKYNGGENNLEVIKRAIELGMGHTPVDEVLFKTWLILWKMDEAGALNLIGEAGYIRLVWPRIPTSQLKKFDWKKMLGDIKGVAVWSRGRDDIPIVKTLVVEDVKDLGPLFMSDNKEVRLLAAQLAKTVRRDGRGEGIIIGRKI